jgi:hypothetical protein
MGSKSRGIGQNIQMKFTLPPDPKGGIANGMAKGHFESVPETFSWCLVRAGGSSPPRGQGAVGGLYPLKAVISIEISMIRVISPDLFLMGLKLLQVKIWSPRLLERLISPFQLRP